MTPEQEKRLARVEGLLAQIVQSDRYFIGRTVQVGDGNNIQLGNTTGTKIGTATSQKLGFFNKTPVVQQSVAGLSASGSSVGDDTARVVINNIITALENLGLFA